MTTRDLCPRRARQTLYERAREDLWSFLVLVFPEVTSGEFIDATHLRAIVWQLQQIASGGRARLLIAAPPRHFKSFITSVIFPAFMLGRNPGLKILCASYNEDLALSFARQCRQVMQSETYRRIFPGARLASPNPAASDLRTSAGGYRYATSVGGTLTGLGANILIVDDPIKTDAAGSLAVRETASSWLLEAAMTRFDSQNTSAAIVTHQRQHMDDLIGRLKAEGGWDCLELPAEVQTPLTLQTGPRSHVHMAPGQILFPQNFDAKALAAIREEIGSSGYDAQFLQRPTPPGGGLFHFSKIQRFDLPENIYAKNYEALIVSVDPGVSTDPSADFTAITLWGVVGPRLMLLRAEQGRWDMPTQLEKVGTLARKVKAVLIELSHSGIGLAQLLQKQGLKNIFGFKPRPDKQVRAQFAAVAIEKGHVWFPNRAPWLEMVEQQLAAFPFGRHDDIVDSISQLFCKLEKGFPREVELSAYKSDVPIVNVTYLGGRRRLTDYSR